MGREEPAAVSGDRRSLGASIDLQYRKFAEWPLPKRVLFASVGSLPAMTLLPAAVHYFWAAGVGDSLMNLAPLVWLLWGYSLWLLLTAAVAWAFHRRGREARLPAYVFLLGVVLLCGGLLRIFGTTSSAVFAVMPGLLAYQSVMFDTRVGWVGWLLGTLLVAAIAWGDLSGAWAYAPLFRLRQIDDQLMPVFYVSVLLTVWSSFSWVFVQVQLAERLRLERRREIEAATARLAAAKDDLAHEQARAAAGAVVMDMVPRLLEPLRENEPDLHVLEREFQGLEGGAGKEELEVVGRILKAEARAAAMARDLERLSVPAAGASLPPAGGPSRG